MCGYAVPWHGVPEHSSVLPLCFSVHPPTVDAMLQILVVVLHVVLQSPSVDLELAGTVESGGCGQTRPLTPPHHS